MEAFLLTILMRLQTERIAGEGERGRGERQREGGRERGGERDGKMKAERKDVTHKKEPRQ